MNFNNLDRRQIIDKVKSDLAILELMYSKKSQMDYLLTLELMRSINIEDSTPYKSYVNEMNNKIIEVCKSYLSLKKGIVSKTKDMFISYGNSTYQKTLKSMSKHDPSSLELVYELEQNKDLYLSELKKQKDILVEDYDNCHNQFFKMFNDQLSGQLINDNGFYHGIEVNQDNLTFLLAQLSTDEDSNMLDIFNNVKESIENKEAEVWFQKYLLNENLEKAANEEEIKIKENQERLEKIKTQINENYESKQRENIRRAMTKKGDNS